MLNSLKKSAVAVRDALISLVEDKEWERANEKLAQMRESAGTTIDESEDGWRKISGDAERDLNSVTQERMQKLAVYLWESNLLANRIIELPVAYMLAEGVSIVADDESVKDWIDKFWKDPINQMDIKLITKVRQLSLFGEQCYPTYVNEFNGHVRLGYLDPSNIDKVITDPDNPEQPILVITKRDKKGKYRKYKVIVNGDDEALFTARTVAIRSADDIDGEAFYFSINSLSNGSRGRSDLLAQADWMDAYDSFLFGEIDRTAFMRAFVWDVTLKNANETEVTKRASEINAPAPGSVRVHNDSEEWNAVSPGLQTADTTEQARLLRNHSLGGATLPEHWFGGGGDVNRATAGEMGDPTYKVFSMRQTYLQYMLEQILTYQIRQRELAESGGIEPDLSDDIFNFSVQFSEIVSKDLGKYATALQSITVSVVALIANELVSRDTGLQMINKISARLGVEFDAAAELDKVMQQQKDDAAKDVYTEKPNMAKERDE